MPIVLVGKAKDLQKLSKSDFDLLVKMVETERVRRKEYVSYEDVLQILKRIHEKDSSAEAHTSRLWNMLYRQTKYGELEIVGRCTCGMILEKPFPGVRPAHRPGCPALSQDSARHMEFTKESLLASETTINQLIRSVAIGMVHFNYERVIASLRQRGR